MKHLPWLLIGFRLIAAIWLPLLAFYGISHSILASIFIAGFVSDVFDGILARKFEVSTLSLRKADTRTDICFLLGSGLSVYIVSPSIASDWHFWILGYTVLFVLRNLVDYFRYGTSPSYHMWSGKLWAILLFVYAFFTLAGLNVSFFIPIAFTVYTLNTVEGIIATLILPKPSFDIPSLWHAIRLIRSTEQDAAANP